MSQVVYPEFKNNRKKITSSAKPSVIVVVETVEVAPEITRNIGQYSIAEAILLQAQNRKDKREMQSNTEVLPCPCGKPNCGMQTTKQGQDLLRWAPDYKTGKQYAAGISTVGPIFIDRHRGNGRIRTFLAVVGVTAGLLAFVYTTIWYLAVFSSFFNGVTITP